MRLRPRAQRRLSPRFRRAPHDGLALDRGRLDGPLALLVLADALSDADEEEARHEDEVKPRDEDAGAGDRPECPGASEPSRESLTRGQARDRYLGMARHRPEGGEGGVEHLGLDHAAAVRMAWGSQSRRSTVAQSTLRKNASM